MLKSAARNPVAVTVGLSALVTLALALNVTPWLRGGAGWRWPYQVPANPERLLPGLLALAVYLGLALMWLARLERPGVEPTRSSLALYGLFCALGGVALQLAFLAFHDPNPLRQLFMRTVSTASGGFFEVGVGAEDVRVFLRDFPGLMPGFASPHPKAHPPGIPLLFWAAGRLFGALTPLADKLAAWLRPYQCQQTVIMALPDEAIASASVGMALPVLSMLALWPLYRLARLMYDRAAALRAVTWWPLLPALVMFVPQWNQFYPLLALLALWLLALGLRRRRWPLFALSGAVVSLATFLSFTNVAAVGLLGVYVGAWAALTLRRGEWPPPGGWPRLAANLGAFGAGLAWLWLLYYALAGVSFFEILSISLRTHYGLGHPYLPWLLLLPVDFGLFGGLALVALAAARAAHGWRSGDALALALGVGFVTLDVSGVLRGEVGRLLLWMMPLGVLLAARAVTQCDDPRRATWAISAALGAQLVVMVAFLRVIDPALDPPPQSAPAGEALAASRPVQAAFGQRAVLTSFEAAPVPGEMALEVRLRWQARARFDHPNYAGVIVLGPQGQTLGVRDWLAGSEEYPTTCWRPGEVVPDTVRVSLEAMPPGEYWLSLRMFDALSGQPLPVNAPGLPDDTQAGLGPVPVP